MERPVWWVDNKRRFNGDDEDGREYGHGDDDNDDDDADDSGDNITIEY